MTSKISLLFSINGVINLKRKTEKAEGKVRSPFTPIFQHFPLTAREYSIVAILSKPVDLITKRAIDRTSHPIRHQEILSTAQTLRSQIVAIALPCTIIPIPTIVGVFFIYCNNKKPANCQSAIALRY